MIDPVDAALAAAAARSPWAAALAFAAGAATSAGPCVAPRFVAIAALAGSAARWKASLAFAGGLALGYVVLGSVAGVISLIAGASTIVYSLVAVVLTIAGFRSLWSDYDAHRCARVRPATISVAMLWGACSTAVASPCCSPIVALLGAYAASRGGSAFGAVTIAAFAAGHAAPLAFAGFVQRWAAGGRALTALRGPVQTVSGALMLALGAYYGVLA